MHNAWRQSALTVNWTISVMKFCVRKIFPYPVKTGEEWDFYSSKNSTAVSLVAKNSFLRSLKNIFRFFKFYYSIFFGTFSYFQKKNIIWKVQHWNALQKWYFSMFNDDECNVWLVYICWRVAKLKFVYHFSYRKMSTQMHAMHIAHQAYVLQLYKNKMLIYERWTISIYTTKSEYWIIWIMLCILCISRVYVRTFHCCLHSSATQYAKTQSAQVHSAKLCISNFINCFVI